MSRWYLARTRFLFPCLLLLLTVGQAGHAAPSHTELSLDDAERFAAVLAATGYRPSSAELARNYLEPATVDLRAFAAGRMGSDFELAQAVKLLRQDYRRAIERCLPAARRLDQSLPGLMGAIAEALGLDADAPAPRVVVLFGAGRSAGTVIDDAVILALEVICRFDVPERAPDELLRAFLVHEVVHAHQLRWQRPGLEDSLLRQALLEGYADLVTEQVLGRGTPPAEERARFGARHEADLWTAFRADMAGTSLAPWMYGPGRPGEPADMGYWLGLRICRAVLGSSGSEAALRRSLLLLEDPFTLLLDSAYGEDLRVP
jgi:hypothetical protein